MAKKTTKKKASSGKKTSKKSKKTKNKTTKTKKKSSKKVKKIELEFDAENRLLDDEQLDKIEEIPDQEEDVKTTDKVEIIENSGEEEEEVEKVKLDIKNEEDFKNVAKDFADMEEFDGEKIEEDIEEEIDEEINGEVNIVENVEKIDDIDIDDKYADLDLDDDEALKNMLADFSETDDLDIDEIMELQEALEEVQEEVEQEEEKIELEDPYDGWGLYTEEDPYDGWGLYEEDREFIPDISKDLEAKLKAELEKKKKKKKIVTEEMFKKYCRERRTKIWYHALWFLLFDMEDHQATKATLYEALKGVTSKSAIDDIEEHKFYFGLGFILRLSINEFRVIDFQGDSLKISKNVGADLLIDLLTEIGPPISERPVITDNEKKDMFMDFLSDDFGDI